MKVMDGRHAGQGLRFSETAPWSTPSGITMSAIPTHTDPEAAPRIRLRIGLAAITQPPPRRNLGLGPDFIACPRLGVANPDRASSVRLRID